MGFERFASRSAGRDRVIFFSRVSNIFPTFTRKIVPDIRTSNYLLQVKLSIVMRMLTVGLSFATTAILIRAMSLENYGVWSLLISIQAWISFFDLGIGNGLRTRVAQSLAHSKVSEAVRLITVAYLTFTAIFLLLMSVLVPAILMVDWQSLLNVSSIAPGELRRAIGITVLLTCLIFVTNLINPVAAAVQRSSYITFAGFANALVFLILAFIMYVTGWSSVIMVLAIQGMVNVIVNIAFTVWFYTRRPELRPTPTLDLSGARDLVSLGGGFFIIQAAMLVLFSTDRFIIVQLLGPAEVPQYDVAFKLFSLFITLHLMIAGPLWSAYTEAYQRSEFDWIRRTIRGQIKVVLVLSSLCVVLAVVAEPIVKIWTGSAITMDAYLVALMCTFAVLSMWNNTFGSMLNGIGHLRIQIIATTLGASLNIPLSIYFVKYLSFGVPGIVLATVLCIGIQSVLLPWAVFRAIQLKKVRAK